MKSSTNSKGTPATEPVWSKRWEQAASCQKSLGESSVTWGMPGACDMTEQEVCDRKTKIQNSQVGGSCNSDIHWWTSRSNQEAEVNKHTNHLVFWNILEWVSFTELWGYMLKINKLCHYEVAIASCCSHWWLLSTIYFVLNNFHVGFTTAEIHTCWQMQTKICHIQEEWRVQVIHNSLRSCPLQKTILVAKQRSLCKFFAKLWSAGRLN